MFAVEITFDGPAELRDEFDNQVRRGFTKVAPDLDVKVKAGRARADKDHPDVKRRYMTIVMAGLDADSARAAERKATYWLRRAFPKFTGTPQRVTVKEQADA